MKFPLLSINGAKTETIEISDKLVKLKVNHKLIKFVIDWQLNHAKPRTAKTKQRNEIKGSTKKIVPQKGGGGARHASKKAPLFVGGGVAHGPKGAEDWLHHGPARGLARRHHRIRRSLAPAQRGFAG